MKNMTRLVFGPASCPKNQVFSGLFRRLYFCLSVLLLLLAVSPVASAATGFTGSYVLDNWSATASNGGTTTITPPSGPADSAAFAYSINLGNPGPGVSFRTWTFKTTAAANGPVTFNWHYTGFHAYFQVTALFQVFSGDSTITPYSAGPTSCFTSCTSPSGGFDVSGTATINATAGLPFGFIVGGSNADSNSQLNGTLTISNFSAPDVAVTGIGSTGTSTNPSGATTTTVNQTVTQGVNTATGNTYITFSDLTVPGKGLRFSFVRSYNDQDPYSGPLGRGWTHSYNILLTVDPTSGAVTIKEADGHQNVFALAGGAYTAPTGVYDVLASAGLNTFTLTRPDQTVLSFGPVSLTPLTIRLLSITDKNLNTQVLSYDPLTFLLKTFTDVGGGIFNFTYDGLNHLTSVSGAPGVLNYLVNSTSLTSYKDLAGNMSSYTYSAANLLQVVMDAVGNAAVNNTFDLQGRVLTTTRPGGICAPTTYAYDDANHITTITDPLNNVTKHYYDTSKHLIKIVNALGFITTFTYDSNNNLTSTTDPLSRTTVFTYDAQGNRTSVTDPLGDKTSFAYDLKNNLVSQTDANSNTTTFGYDPSGNLIKVTDAIGGITNYLYDPHGNKINITDAKHALTVNAFDSANHILSTMDPLGNTTSYTYAAGRLATQTEPAGNLKTLGYDPLGRLKSVTYSAGTSITVAGAVVYTYDANGNRLTMTDSTGVTSYSYDAVNRVISVTFPVGGNVAYTYDCDDNRLSITYAGKTVNYTYDRLNRMTSVADGSKTTTYTYDAANNLLSISYPNGASVGYSYDAANRITQVRNTYTGSAGNPVSSYTYLLDKVGNRTQVTDGSGKVTAFAYDALNRLVNSTVALKAGTYSYDAVGNRLNGTGPGASTGYTYDAADKLLFAGSTSFAYDKNGNQITQTAGTQITTYGFDAADRLLTANNAGTVSSFTYDGDGNRTAQNVGSGTYTYLNDVATGFTTVLDENGPDGHIRYVRGRSLISATGLTSFTNTYYYHYDAQSTVVGVTDDTGHLVQRYIYDVFGQRQLSVPNPGIGTQNKFGYTGEALDPGTSLYYLRSRYYNPALGRFINKDSFLGFDRAPQTLNRFVYVRNNPATLTDRTGFCSDDPDLDASLGFPWPCAPPLP